MRQSGFLFGGAVGSLRGLYLTKPHSGLIVDGRKSIIVRGEDKDLSGEWALVEKDKALGRMVLGSPYSVPGDRFSEFFFAHRVRDGERIRWWGDKDTFFFSDILAFEPFAEGPVPVPVPPGTTLIIDDLPLDEKGYRLDKCMNCKAAPEVDVLWAEGKGRAWFCRKCFLEWATKGDGRGEICSAYYVKDGRVASKWKERSGPRLKGKSGQAIYDALAMIAAIEGEKEHTGAMIALFLPDSAAQRLALKTDSDKIKVVPPEEMHITLCYLGDSRSVDLVGKKDVIGALVSGLAQQCGPVRGVVGGLGLFSTAEEAGGNALYASFDSPALSSFREAIAAVLDMAGIKPATGHGFTPHITLAYLPPGMKPDLELPGKVPILFDNLTLAWGGEYTAHPLLQTETKADRSRADKFVWKEGDLEIDGQGEKGSAASGNWGHTSFNRMDVGRGGSDPSGTGGALGAIGVDKDSTLDERRAASDELRKQKPEDRLRARMDKAPSFGDYEESKYDIKDWGNEHFGEWAESLSEQEMDDIHYYTSTTSFAPMNAVLRHREAALRDNGPEWVEQYEPRIANMQDALSRASVPHDQIVHRGVDENYFHNVLGNVPVGGTFVDKGFVSTALREDTEFGHRTLRILVPKGTQGAFMSSRLSSYDHEAELLLNAGTRFMKVGDQGGVLYFAVVQQGVKARESGVGMEWGQKPYTIDNPPPRISGLPDHAKRIWVSAFNSAFEQYGGDEGKANATAWAAVKRKYHKEGDQWVANKSIVRAAKSLDRIEIFAEKHNLDVEHVGVPIPFVFDRDVAGTVTVVKYADREGRKLWRSFLNFDTPIPYGADLLHAVTIGMKGLDDVDEALDRAREHLWDDEKTLLALSDDDLEQMYAATQAMLSDSIKSLAANLSPEQMNVVLDKVVEVVGEKGSAASGNWMHSSFNRMGVGRGGSDPAGRGGSLGKLGLEPDSTTEERREASARLRQERSEDKEPAGKKPKFPTSLDDLEKEKHLGGSTGAVLVRDPATGELYVRKQGGNPDHIREESTADQVYQALGVQVPEHKMYDTPEGPTKLAQFVEGRSLNDVRQNNPEQFERAREKLKDDFVADALLANWDVVGLDFDNVLVDGQGNPWRIDNGGSLRFRAMGTRKTAQQWNNKPMEIWSLRNAGVNSRTARIFGDLSFSDIVGQMQRVGARRQTILDAVPRELRGVIGGRLDTFASIVTRAQELRQTGMDWAAVDKAVETWMAGQ